MAYVDITPVQLASIFHAIIDTILYDAMYQLLRSGIFDTVIIACLLHNKKHNRATGKQTAFLEMLYKNKTLSKQNNKNNIYNTEVVNIIQ